MSNRLLLIAVATLVLLFVGLMTGPAFSGEHPWDSDRGEGSGGGTKHPVLVDTTLVAPDTIGVVASPVTVTTMPPRWTVVVRVAWTALMAM